MEEVSILKVETGEAVKSIADLKDNVKILKETLNGLEIGTGEYQTTLKELQTNQKALKDAMYATSASMEQVATNAKGLNVQFNEQNQLIDDGTQSYNALVNSMAELKTQWRATSDVVERAKIGTQINSVNDKLKEMDASVGNFQRNVGNYQSAFKGLGEGADVLHKSLGFTEGSLNGVKDGFEALSKNPAIAIFGIVLSVVKPLIDKLKENKQVTDALSNAMKSLEPVMDIVSNVVEKLAGWVSKAVDYFAGLMKGSGDTFKNIISGAVGVGNVLLQYLLTPVRNIIDGFKGLGQIIKDIFTGNWKAVKDDAKSLATDIGDNFKKGFDIKANFEKGKEAGETFMAGLAAPSTQEKAKDAGVTLGKEVAKGVEEGFKIDIDKAIAESEKRFEDRLKAEADFQKEFADQTKEWDAAVSAEADEMGTAMIDDFLAPYLEATEKQKEADKEAIQSAAERVDAQKSLVAITSNLLGSLADIFEASGDESEANAKRVKGLQIAEATINTISGAVGAFMGITRDTGGWGVAAAAAEAAAITASGIAQITKIKNTSTSSSSSASASVSAPSVSTNISNVRSLTTDAEEERLNQMASDQRVYILSSDIEASQNAIKAQVAEASF